MTNDALMSMLIALRIQHAAMAAQIEAALGLVSAASQEAPDESKKPACLHQRRLNWTTMGGPEHWECKDCGHVHKEVPGETDDQG